MKNTYYNYYRLKSEIQTRYPDTHFFDRATLKFFGERESESRVLKKTVTRNGHICLILSTCQHNAPAGISKRHYTYFDIVTLEQIF